MMSVRTILVVVLALACGVAAAVGVAGLKPVPKAGMVETVPILVAKLDVPRGNVLRAENLRTENWPKDHLPEGHISDISAAEDRTVTVRLVKGEPILQQKLADKDSGRGLASMIPPGMRAFTIQASHAAAGVGGFILPGNHVDVLLTTSSPASDQSGGAATTTLLQNVQILAVAQLLDAPDANKVDPKEFRDVTLLVTPSQAAKLDLGMNKGTLHLSLRNPDDHLQADTRPATLSQLRFHEEEVSPTSDMLAKTFSTVAKMINAASLTRPGPNSTERTDDTESDAVGRVTSKKTREARIRTLRGTSRGVVRIEFVN